MSDNQDAKMTAAVGRLLGRQPLDPKKFVHDLGALAERYGAGVYGALLFAAVHLEFGQRAALKHFSDAVRHWESLLASTGREVDFRVALLDYFLTINRRIKNPKIIEVKIFEKTRQETELDELTRLYNFRYFNKAVQNEVVRSKRYHAPMSLVLFDIDDFKHYNDTNGHPAGNRALKKFAGIIRKTVREVDIAARFGGEEFALLLPETNKQGAFTIAERIRKAVARASFVNARSQPLKRFSVSGGVASLHVDAKSVSALIKRADQALYQAKARGKNQIALYVNELREHERVSTAIMGRLNVPSTAGDVVLVEDISESGLLFRYERALPMATVCQLALPLPGRQTTVCCQVKVRRVEELKRDRLYGIGASIVQMKATDKKALKTFVRSLADLNVQGSGAGKK